MDENRKIEWGRYGVGYECSSQGDHRFSALYATLPDGRTIEQHYQCDVKGYDPGGRNWKLGKGKQSLRQVDLWAEYLALWRVWAGNHPVSVQDLRKHASRFGYRLTDVFARTPINQAHALACILNGTDE